MGVKIHKDVKWGWVFMGFVSLATSLIAAVWWGPSWVYASAGAGILIAATGIVLSRRRPVEYPSAAPSVAVILLQVLFFAAGFVLESLFLQPLADEALDLPRFNQRYVDPRGLFEMVGPARWEITEIPAVAEHGVQLRPIRQRDYIGVSEVKLFVRPIEKAPAAPDEFLTRIARSLSTTRPAPGRKYFEVSTETAKLIGGGQGVWATLDIQRFWIPLRQVTLYGIKDGRYLCGVSATGLRSHATLSKVICLGLLEAIRIRDPK